MPGAECRVWRYFVIACVRIRQFRRSDPLATQQDRQLTYVPEFAALVVELHWSASKDIQIGATWLMAAYSHGLSFLSKDHSTSALTESEKLHILLVGDQTSTLDLAGCALKSAGYTLYHAHTSKDALRGYQSERPQLIVIHLSSREMDGNDLIRQLRKWTSTPIIVVSAHDAESEIIACLDSGADDFIREPFTIGELLARIRAALRRAFGVIQDEVFTAGDLRVDFNRREVFVGHQQVRLTATEYQLLNVLVRHVGVVRTHHQLIHEVWGTTQYQDPVHLLRVTVSNLRRKVACDSTRPLPIVTEPGVGYRLQSDVSCDACARAN
jgi:two-component system, OmpR family, KDP operon response regulator KdpE